MMRSVLASYRRVGLLLPLGLVLVVGIVPYFTGSALLRENIFLMLMFATLASSLNIMLGYTGYVNFGSVVFFGLGGYVSFLLVLRTGMHILLAALVAGAVASLFALLIGEAVLRLRGAYFALATIGVNEVMRALITNLDLFGGSTGMTLDFSVYQPYGGAWGAQWFVYGCMLAVALIVTAVSFGVKNSKAGLGMQAVREDEDAANAMGVRSPRIKTLAYCLSAFFPGMAGALFFFKNANIEPAEAFNIMVGIESIVMVMLGGAGTVLGPILGAGVYERLCGLLITGPEALRELQLFFAGLLLLIVILFVSEGLVGFLRKRVRRARAVLE